MELSSVKKVYFIGAGGIGMSAIARYFLNRKIAVSGYDKTPTPLTTQLVEEGMKLHFEDNIELLDEAADLVIYTPAIPKDHTELNWYKDNGFKLWKRSDVLQAITKDKFSICIGGTHGKTTISAITAHVLHHSGFGCMAFLGGIASNYNSNFWNDGNDICVIEADEYDRSFHKLSPSIAVISAMDADHLDIYGTPEAMEDAFVEFAKKTKPHGLLIYKCSLNRLQQTSINRKLAYDLYNIEADVFARNVKTVDGGYQFDVQIKNDWISDVHLSVGGLHNVENALVAITIAKELNIDDEKIKAALANFKGVKRRFEYVLKTEKCVIIDDYAHHPKELEALISGAKSVFPDRKITIVFQPHLYSRTRDLADDFAAVLDKADNVMLLPIYPARELPIEGVSSEIILNKMKNSKSQIVQKNELLNKIKEERPELLLMAGAGDIDALVKPVVELF
jgi:UDP-N-acetylmuramate--alanine ligase